ncbi:N5-glutamine methyltransferase family protein, partial [Rothia dentocariosa]
MTGLRVTPTAHRGEGLDEALRRGADVLRRAGIEQYRADAELLAAYLLDTDSQGIQGGSYGKTHVTRADVQRFALMGRRITPQDSVRYMELLERRAQRVPLQHITGVAPFYHLEMKVGPGVFIPRPETELLVEEALRVLATYESNARPRVVDLCTGSGAIAAAIKEENPQAEVFAVELSEQALLWARKNLDPQNVHLIPGDIRTSLEDLPGYFDLVLSNPPYIPSHSKPQAPEVAEYDPQMALYGGG